MMFFSFLLLLNMIIDVVSALLFQLNTLLLLEYFAHLPFSLFISCHFLCGTLQIRVGNFGYDTVTRYERTIKNLELGNNDNLELGNNEVEIINTKLRG